MKAKKSDKVNLEKKRVLFFQIGLVIVLGIVFSAFEWSTRDLKVIDPVYLLSDDSEPVDRPPITFPDKPEPPKPPVVKKLEIVDNTEDTDELILINAETSPGDSVSIVKKVELPDEIEDNTIYEIGNIQIAPEFPGGEHEMQVFIKENLKVPQHLKEIGVGGKVYVSFVINKKGDITGVEIARGVDPFLDAEAVRVVKSMPKWSPAFRNGEYVNSRFILPIKVSFK